MLGKLLKYELKATSRLLLYMYLGLIIIAVVNMVTMPINRMEAGGQTHDVMTILSGLLIVIYVIMAIAAIVVTSVYLVVRFYRNQLGDEGYLMFTLPVSVDKHILSKLISAMIWSFTSLVVLAVSILIMMARVQVTYNIYGDVAEFWRTLVAAGGQPLLWIIGFLAVLLLSMLGGFTQYYAAMSIGPNLIKNRLGGSILAYIIIYVVYNVVSAVLLFVWFLPVLAMANTEEFSALVGQSIEVTPTSFSIYDGAMEMMQVFNTIGLYALGYCVTLYLLTVIPCYLVTRYMLKRKLNLA
jgi:hypothetical protein